MKKGLLIISGGILQIFALKRARELGIETYLVDGSNECAARDYADHFYLLSTKDVDGVALLAKDLKEKGKIDGVYTQGADVEYTVACAAKEAGLPGISPEVARNCNDKIRARKILSESGVSSVPYAVVNTPKDASEAVKQVGFPCYVKPADNSASRGTTRLTSEEGLQEAVETALEACYSFKSVLIEREIVGVEYSVDTVMYQGVLYPAGVSDRAFLSKEKYAVHIGSRTPSLLPAETQDEMYKVMERAAAALGVTGGAFKGDLVVEGDTNNVEIIEVTARTSGGHDSQLRKPLSFGIDLMKATMDIALGSPLNPIDLVPRWVKWSSTFAIFPEPGVVTEIVGVEDTRKIEGVKDITLLVEEGNIIEPYIHSAKRSNFITVVADTYEGLLALEERVRKTLLIKTKVS